MAKKYKSTKKNLRSKPVLQISSRLHGRPSGSMPAGSVLSINLICQEMIKHGIDRERDVREIDKKVSQSTTHVYNKEDLL